jgi:hypothetical protein
MRLGVFLLFLAIAFATASPAALAQLSPPPLPDVAKPGKEAKPDKPAKKPDKEAKPDKGGQKAGPGDDEEAGPGDEEGGPVPEEDGNDEDGDTGGESGGGESGADTGPVDNDPAGSDRSTSSSSSADEGGPTALVSDAGCPEECDPPGDPTDGEERDAILATDVAGEFENEAGARSPLAAADPSPAVLVLFALMVLGLLVGLAGGLRALHGRIRDS